MSAVLDTKSRREEVFSNATMTSRQGDVTSVGQDRTYFIEKILKDPKEFFQDPLLTQELLRLEEKERIEIAKIAAAQNGWVTSQHIQNYGITDQDALIEIAKIAAGQNGWVTSQHIQNYGITDQDVLIEIAKIAAAQHGRGTSEYIQNYGITDQDVLIEIAKIAAAQHGRGTSEYIQNYGITDQGALIEIAKIAAQNGGGTSEYIQNYGITDQDVLIEIAKIAAAQNGRGTSEYIQNYGITDQDVLIEIAKIAAAQDGRGTSEYIQNYGITDQKALIEIAKIAAQSGQGTSEHIQNYGITDQDILIEIAKISAAREGYITSKYIKNYGITDQDALIEIAKIAAAQDGEGISFYIQNYGITDQKVLIEIAKIAVLSDPRSLSAISNYNLEVSEVLNQILLDQVESRTENFDLSKLIQFLAENPSLLEPEPSTDWQDKAPHEKALWAAQKIKEICPLFDDTLFDYQNEVQSEASVYGALVATIKTWNQVIPNGKNRARLALREVSGLSSLPLDELSINSRTALYETIFSAGQMSKTPLQEFLQLNEEDWKQNFDATLSLILQSAACTSLGVSKEKLIELSGIPLNDRLSSTKELLSEAFKEAFGLSSGDGVSRLIEEWGTIEPLIILFSRYKNSRERSWQEEIPVLKEIIEKTLEGTFHDWKYSQPQSQVFTSEQLTGWRQNPSSLELYQSGTEQINPLDKARLIFERNILHNIPSEDAQIIRATIQEMPESLPATDKEFNKQFKSLNNALKVLETLLRKEESEKLKGFVTLLMNCKENLLKNFDPTIKKQISDDLRSLKECVNQRSVQAGREYLVFNTITDDPKLLLTVGDLVKTSSCQNYRTGGYIQTLPGYVMDANIKVALSYVVPLERLKSEFKVQEINVKELSYSFNAPKQEITFTLADQSVTIFLGSAVNRRILRAGTNEAEETTLFVEGAYSQNHAIESQIDNSLHGLIRAFQRMCGVRAASGLINFPASSNPSGIYSDAAGGIKTGAYEIKL